MKDSRPGRSDPYVGELPSYCFCASSSPSALYSNNINIMFTRGKSAGNEGITKRRSDQERDLQALADDRQPWRSCLAGRGAKNRVQRRRQGGLEGSVTRLTCWKITAKVGEVVRIREFSVDITSKDSGDEPERQDALHCFKLDDDVTRSARRDEAVKKSLEQQTRRVGLQRKTNESDGSMTSFKAPRVEERRREERRKEEEQWEDQRSRRGREGGSGESGSRFEVVYPESSCDETMQGDEGVQKKEEDEQIKGLSSSQLSR
eukprot:762692-Hanusia_phi.AAC.1